MNTSRLFVLFAAAVLQLGVVVLADGPGESFESGKPGQGAERELGGWSGSSKSSKGSKSTDEPTLFPTQSPTLFPTLAPTYCGKSGKSSWSGSCSKSTKSSWSSSRSHRKKRDLEQEDAMDRNEVELEMEDGKSIRRRKINSGRLVDLEDAEP